MVSYLLSIFIVLTAVSYFLFSRGDLKVVMNFAWRNVVQRSKILLVSSFVCVCVCVLVCVYVLMCVWLCVYVYVCVC